jgi:aspartate aminotransferase-like enzyme
MFTPGPTPIHDAVARAMTAPMPHHRTDEFIECMQRTQRLLQQIYRTQNPVILLSSSGTGAMEAAVVNLTEPGETVLCASGGKFTERWGELLRTYGRQVQEIPVAWGDVLTPEKVHDALQKTPSTALFVTHSETSTGALCDLQQIARVARDHGALIVVDAITSLGVHQLETDGWQLDCVLAGSQKAFMMPPGLAFLSLSAKAQDRLRVASSPRFYFDLCPALTAIGKGQTPWTPAISLVMGLEAACNVLMQEGLEQVWLRHQATADAVRAGVAALGLTIVSQRPSNAVTAVHIPEPLQADLLRAWLWDHYAIKVAGGQGPLRGRIVRLGHLGDHDAADIILLMTAFERGLREHGLPSTVTVTDLVASRLPFRRQTRVTP